ncbi:3-hydroxyacyl-ACP dehydratase FabZ family protein [Flavobacterium cerinum]|uniref:Beta-hydroxyacyl-ACP dehydratase n=1 Tax=Flavobacterium cerinum TaxID=2502784 RepID=A0ABY5IU46_9FLAO|nr:3-hydroxyacyl-ACP dehydratase FabZ family protein [Flavobacterium cerinum]UUC45881.1 beta-hydroxyacyl-ACP dehydratase [Flavobacterium cerinum]
MEGNKNVEELIPHRAPFLFVDEVLSANEKEIIGVYTFEKDTDVFIKGSFPEMLFVPGTILVESMAQCGGAGVRMLGVSKGVFALAQIESAQFYKGVTYGDQVKYVIEILRMSEKIIKQSGKAYVGDDLILEASWMSIRIDSAE